MKIDIDLPWGGKLHYEHPPMSPDTRFTLTLGIGSVLILLFFLALIYMLR